MSSAVEAPTLCPDCGARLPVDAGYSPWCEGCGWNVDPYPPSLPQRRLAQRRVQLGADLDARLLAVAADSSSSAAKRVAFTLSIAVHLLTIGLAVLGVEVAVGNTIRGAVRVVIVGILALIVLSMVPRMPGLPRHTKVVREADAPGLWRLIRRVAEATRSPLPNYIVLTPEYDAWSATVGFRRRRVLGIGMALWSTITPAERVAALGHELAHGRRGDCRGNLLVQTAGESLRQWGRLLGITTPPGTRSGHYLMDFGLAEYQATQFVGVALFNVLTILPRRVFMWWSRGLSIATARAGQRGEYFADDAAAAAASSKAMLSLLDELYLVDVVQAWEHRLRIQRRAAAWPELRATLDAVPPRQVERLRRVGRLRHQRIDATHPSTAARIDVVNARPARAGTVWLSDGDDAAITAELAAFSAPVPRQRRTRSD
jgi:Zn-dependent protease with chaperone function